jgi:hypothetical protein
LWMRVTRLLGVADAPGRASGAGLAGRAAGGLEAGVGCVRRSTGSGSVMCARQAWGLIECGRRARFVGCAVAARREDAAIRAGSVRPHRRFGFGVSARPRWHA